MEKLWACLVLLAPLSALFMGPSGPQATSQGAFATLYSPHKHKGDLRKSCLNFQTAVRSTGTCDLRYGMLYAGDQLDWFESSVAAGDRSVIKDLGAHDWNDHFRVPVVEPLPRLKEGERRHFSVDASGGDGKPGTNSDGIVRAKKEAGVGQRPGNDGKLRVDSLWVKAVVGHIYVLHVVDEVRDFYALFRVEVLERGDNCTISWTFVPAPSKYRW